METARIYRQMPKLESYFNHDTTESVLLFKQGKKILLDQANAALFCKMAINEAPYYLSSSMET